MSATVETKSKHCDFILYGQKPKTQIWAVMPKSGGYTLGYVKWYAPWRQYCFEPLDETVWSKSCLADIIKFIEELMSTRHFEGR